MTRILGLMLAGVLLAPLPAAAGDLTLRDVMELHRTGLGEDLLIAVIDADGGPFRLSFADIQDLKSDGLSERVIGALVRTGARQPALDTTDAAAGPVPVYQEVVPYVPAVVIVATPVVPVCCVGSHPGHASRRLERPDRVQPPPAAWVTQREDGRNVPATPPRIRSSVPPATWVTPRDPQPRERRSPDSPAPTPR